MQKLGSHNRPELFYMTLTNQDFNNLSDKVKSTNNDTNNADTNITLFFAYTFLFRSLLIYDE